MERELSVLSYSVRFRIRLELEGGRTFNETSLVKLSANRSDTFLRDRFYLVLSRNKMFAL